MLYIAILIMFLLVIINGAIQWRMMNYLLPEFKSKRDEIYKKGILDSPKHYNRHGKKLFWIQRTVWLLGLITLIIYGYLSIKEN